MNFLSVCLLFLLPRGLRAFRKAERLAGSSGFMITHELVLRNSWRFHTGVMCSTPHFPMFFCSFLWNILRLCFCYPFLFILVVIFSFFLTKSWNIFFLYISASGGMISYTYSHQILVITRIFYFIGHIYYINISQGYINFSLTYS